MQKPPGQLSEPLAEFVDELVRLRAAAGNPSFRKMAAKSGAVSHATLHQTVAGHRLQPWETVREFVRACDGDEEAMHERWERTHLALTEHRERAAGDDEPAGRLARLRRPRTLAAAVASAVVLAVAVAVTLTAVGDPPAEPAAGQRTAERAPASRGVATPGDASRFVEDVTVPDGTNVEPGEEFVKVWKFQNAGSVPWRDRYLRRIDPLGEDTCRTVQRVRIRDTDPKERVEIKVKVTAPSTAPVDCKIRWKMVDESGKQLFPSSRPVFFLVHVRK